MSAREFFRRHNRIILVIAACVAIVASLAIMGTVAGAYGTSFNHAFNTTYRELTQDSQQIDKLNIGEFSYENCAYIYVRNPIGQDFVTHKGNCTNPDHKQFLREIINSQTMKEVPNPNDQGGSWIVESKDEIP